MYASSFFIRRNLRKNTFYNLSAFFHHSSKNKIGELCILRHAESDHNLQNCCAGYNNGSIPTAAGIEKTHQTGQLLSQSGVKFDRLYASPFRRAYMTAEVLSKYVSFLEITIVIALAERNFGAFTGMSKNEIEKKLRETFHKYIHDKHFRPPNITFGHKYYQSEKLFGTFPQNHEGESYQCLINRLIPFLEQIMEELLNGQNILIVGHSHALQILQMLLYAGEFEQGIDQYKLDHVAPILFRFALNSKNKLIVKEKINLCETATFDAVSRPMSSV